MINQINNFFEKLLKNFGSAFLLFARLVIAHGLFPSLGVGKYSLDNYFSKK